MKPHLTFLCAVLLTSCVETTETRPDGTVIRSKRIEEGVLPFLGDAMRHQLRMPTKIQPTK